VVVAWYNDPTTNSYDHNYISPLKPISLANDIPSTYTVDGNRALGGTLPTVGWTTLAAVNGNSLHSRQHVVNLTGYNWVRLQVTASDGTPLNQGVFLNMDVHDASVGLDDDWIFFGDSITEAGMAHSSLAASGGQGTWAQVINAANHGYFPAYENGGIGGSESSDGADRINAWLSTFPGRYVGLSYGGNDAGWSRTPSSYYDNYDFMIRAVLAYGKTPVIPKIAWSCDATLAANAPALNQQIDRLYAAYPSIVHGPDLWSFFQANQSLISSDCIHPTAEGYVAYRQQWANAMLAAVYP
jgi:lysophospholipase L1-like esterase